MYSQAKFLIVYLTCMLIKAHVIAGLLSFCAICTEEHALWFFFIIYMQLDKRHTIAYKEQKYCPLQVSVYHSS